MELSNFASSPNDLTLTSLKPNSYIISSASSTFFNFVLLISSPYGNLLLKQGLDGLSQTERLKYLASFLIEYLSISQSINGLNISF